MRGLAFCSIEKLVLILIVLFASFNAYCQPKVECTYMDKAIHCDEFTKRFSVSKYESPDLIIVDENRYIDSFNLNPIEKKLVHVSREQKYKFGHVVKEAKNVIVLHKIDN